MAKPKPDPILCKDQLAALQAMLKAWGREVFSSAMFWILGKFQTDIGGEQTRLMPFRFHLIQRQLDQTLAKNNLLVKPRQIGGTTYFLLVRLLIPAITEGGIGSLLISQNREYVQKHFAIARRADRYLGVVDPYNPLANQLHRSLKQNLLYTAYSNRSELIYSELDSRVMVATAEVEESAQGITLHHIVADEYSRWPHNPEATLNNVRGALVPNGTCDKQCTANGAAGPFYEDVLRAMNDEANSDAKLHYFSWWYQDEYRLSLSQKEAEELRADINEEEMQVIKQIRKDLSSVAYV